MKTKVIIFLAALSMFACSTEKKEVYVASGGGYRKPVTEIKENFEKNSDMTVNCIFGNMQQISTQAKSSSKIGILIGDSKFLNKTEIEFSERKDIGKGKLILVFSKKLAIKSVSDLASPAIEKILMPDPKKAIYGRATSETLDTLALSDKLQEKLVVVQTVPQVSSYLTSGTAEVGFINMTDYISLDKEKFDYIAVPEENYTPIVIEAAMTKSAGKSDKKLLEFIQSEEAQAIFNKYGLSM